MSHRTAKPAAATGETPANPAARATTQVCRATGNAQGATAAQDAEDSQITKAAKAISGTGATEAAAGATEATDGTGARTADAAEVIIGARARIDALDERIIGLVRERMAVSALIQESRIISGGRRVNLSREMEVLGRYRRALGKPGTALAMTLLELCRGHI
jgi:chorismate mutase